MMLESPPAFLRAGWGTVLAGLTAAFGGTLPGAAFAAPPKVLAFPYQRLQSSLPDDLGEQTLLIVTREVGHGGVTVIRRDNLQGGTTKRGGVPSDSPTGNPKAEARAERQMGKARAAMEDDDLREAVRRLQKAVDLLESNGDAVVDLRVLSEAYLMLGVALFRNGEEDEADEALSKAVHLDPEKRLDASSYPPIFIKVFDRSRYHVLRRPRGDVEIQARLGARVLLDGRSMGKAPVLLKNVLPGTHWIRVEQPGESVQAKKVRIRSKKTIVLPFAGAPTAGEPSSDPGGDVLSALSGNQLGAEHLAALRKAGREAGAQFVMVGAVFGTDVAYEIRTGLLDVKTGQIGRLNDVAFDLDLLSAEIEVFKLAEDAQKQIKAGALRAPEPGPSWVPAPDFKPVGRSLSETRIATAIAAPPPIGRPGSIYAKAPPPMPTGVSASPKSSAIPKDELPSELSESAVRDEQGKNEGPDLWWVWVLVGVAAAGAAGAATYVVLSDQDSDQGTVQVRW